MASHEDSGFAAPSNIALELFLLCHILVILLLGHGLVILICLVRLAVLYLLSRDPYILPSTSPMGRKSAAKLALIIDAAKESNDLSNVRESVVRTHSLTV